MLFSFSYSFPFSKVPRQVRPTAFNSDSLSEGTSNAGMRFSQTRFKMPYKSLVLEVGMIAASCSERTKINCPKVWEETFSDWGVPLGREDWAKNGR